MLAIVIPYYKLIFFDETLKSLSNQTDKRFRVYIGDDASPENPEILLDQYKDKIDFIYHRFNENLGRISLVKQWERCLDKIAEEEWIMILGDDDVLHSNVVNDFYDNLLEIEDIKCNVVRFGSQLINEEGNVISDIYKHPKLEKATDSFWRKYIGKTRSSLSEYIFKKEVYLKVKFKNYPLAWHSDDLAWLEFSNFQSINSINSSLVYVRESNLSISGKRDNLDQKKQANLQFYKQLSEHYLPEFTKEQRLGILLILEKDFFENKSFFLFLKIVRWHLIKTDLFNLAKFIRRICINS